MSGSRRESVSGRDKVVRILQRHVDSTSGITNTMLNNFCALICENGSSPSKYMGVFAADEIPISMLREESDFNIVINLTTRASGAIDSHNLRLGHFVTIHVRPDFVLYIDPIGLPCIQLETQHFLTSMKKPVFSNEKKIQSLSSPYCAMYAILYTCYFNEPRPNFRIEFADNAKKSNDQKCVNYLRRVVDMSW